MVYAGTCSFRKGETPMNVAIKKLDLTTNAESVAALTHEAGIMQGLSHANILKCFAAIFNPTALDSSGAPLGCCLILELCPNGSLRAALDALRSGSLSGPAASLMWPARRKIALEVARGMRHLYDHTPQLQHRDLKVDPGFPVLLFIFSCHFLLVLIQ